MKRESTRISWIGVLLVLLVVTGPAWRADAQDGFQRDPVGPVLGHIDAHQALMTYRSADEGTLTMQVAEARNGHPDWAKARLATATSKHENDYCVSWRITDLQPDTAYRYRVVRGDDVIAEGATFKTAPPPDAQTIVALGFGSCLDNKKHDDIWKQVLDHGCQGFVMLGDTPYIPGDSNQIRHIRPQRRILNRLLTETGVGSTIPIWWTWDDHDSFIRGTNDPEKKADCLQVFKEYTAQDTYGEDGEAIYTKFRRGPVEVFIFDMRWWHKTPNSFADPKNISLIGSKQFDWIKRELKASTAPVKVLVSGMIWYKKISEGDSWLDYPHERDALFQFIGDENISGVVLVGGDIHASSYCVFDTEEQVGYDLRSLTSSPMHGGAMERHNYKDRGYLKWGTATPFVFMKLEVDNTVEPIKITAQWIQMAGDVIHEETMTLDQLTKK